MRSVSKKSCPFVYGEYTMKTGKGFLDLHSIFRKNVLMKKKYTSKICTLLFRFGTRRLPGERRAGPTNVRASSTRRQGAGLLKGNRRDTDCLIHITSRYIKMDKTSVTYVQISILSLGNGHISICAAWNILQRIAILARFWSCVGIYCVSKK